MVKNTFNLVVISTTVDDSKQIDLKGLKNNKILMIIKSVRVDVNYWINKVK